MRARAASGFSFVELLATLAILATLLLIAIPAARTVMQRHREAELRVALATIRGAIDRYHDAAVQGRIALEADASGYPPNLAVLAEGVEDLSRPDRRRIYFLRKLPADPLKPDGWRDPAASWGLRSYASPPEEPAEGEDVFDVYSTASGTGLNGVPYRDW
jgi:general secretion pathway protein G